jgi:dTDP-4-dehydrorhamnose 3,5-epimerase
MKVVGSEVFADVLIVEPRVFHDPRGYFLETYQEERYSRLGLGVRFVQDNLSYSKKGVLRGLHYQVGRAQGKLVWVAKGEIFDVVVDVRRSSPTFGRWFGMRLNGEGATQLYIPEGFAHGFCVTSEEAIVCYKCTDYYSPAHERGIRWDDPDLGIQWPISDPILSEKDSRFPFLKELSHEDLFP